MKIFDALTYCEVQYPWLIFQIIVLAIVYACLCRKPEKDEYEPAEIELLEDEVYVHENSSASDMSNAEKRHQIQMQLKRTRTALPPELQALQNAREQRLL